MFRRLYAAAFVDAGNAWREAEDFALDELRWSAGPGVRLALRDAVIALDYGIQLDEGGEGRVALSAGVPLRL
jgi:outer membrane protein assembly factor BamA